MTYNKQPIANFIIENSGEQRARFLISLPRRSLPEVTAAIASGEDVDALDREGRTALFYAVRDGDVAIAAELVRHGANVNVHDRDGKTPLLCQFISDWSG